MSHKHTKMQNHLKAISRIPTNRVAELLTVNPKSNKCAVTQCASSKCLNITIFLSKGNICQKMEHDLNIEIQKRSLLLKANKRSLNFKKIFTDN